MLRLINTFALFYKKIVIPFYDFLRGVGGVKGRKTAGFLTIPIFDRDEINKIA